MMLLRAERRILCVRAMVALMMLLLKTPEARRARRYYARAVPLTLCFATLIFAAAYAAPRVATLRQRQSRHSPC